MFVDNLYDTFYINSLNTILMNGHHKHDVRFSKYMMTPGYAIKQEIFRFEQFLDVRKRHIVRALTNTLEKSFTLGHNRKTNILPSDFLGFLVNRK